MRRLQSFGLHATDFACLCPLRLVCVDGGQMLEGLACPLSFEGEHASDCDGPEGFRQGLSGKDP